MKIFFNIVLLFVVITTFGCNKPEKEQESQFLLKTSFVTITGSDFSEELELKIAAYPYNIKENLAEYNKMIIFLVSSLSEESLILSSAIEKGVTITDQEFETAEKELKKDYPKDSFEQMLLKNAISYSFWRKRFKKTLIMDKLIDQELKQKIVITPEDIVEFYKKHTLEKTNKSANKSSDNSSSKPDNKTLLLNKIDNENELVSRLRMQKTQDGYKQWIQNIEKEYPIEINKNLLKSFLIETKIIEETENEKEN